jgi:hypothetical protein
VPEHPPSPLYTGFAGTPVDDTGFGGTPDSPPPQLADRHQRGRDGGDSRFPDRRSQRAAGIASSRLTHARVRLVRRAALGSKQQRADHSARVGRALLSDGHRARLSHRAPLVLNEVASRSSSATEHRRILHALRADSAGAPSGHKQVVAWGEPWPSTELKEMGDHKGNGTWRHVTKQEIPADRRIHRLLWVYKLKQDGSAKARLCVDGSSMRGNGIDYNQTSSDALKYESARSLFAMSARSPCRRDSATSNEPHPQLHHITTLTYV